MRQINENCQFVNEECTIFNMIMDYAVIKYSSSGPLTRFVRVAEWKYNRNGLRNN